ncbi:MAG: type 1 glutamine amidotransferase [Actinobacteria bacterium]|nr:type 1 glutamine amidotransferase [Actinomycetota bacterium]
MRVLALTYQSDAGPGVFAEAVRARGGEIDEWLIPDGAEPPSDPYGYDAVMTFGGSMNTDEEGGYPWIRSQRELIAGLVDAGRPLLGACLGAQLLVEAIGGQVLRMPGYEIGWFDTEVLPEAADDPLIGPMAPGFESFNWHRYECLLPAGVATLARSEHCVHAFRIREAVWGIQFHAEVTPANANSWIDEWKEDEDSVTFGPDPELLRAETSDKIAAWNEVGRSLCTRFLDAVAASRALPS